MQNFVGKKIGRYQVTEQIGVGGMAVVYKAYDTRLERDIAIKIIRREAIPPEQVGQLMLRFKREAKAMAGFSHPNIVPVYVYGEVDGSPYLVMEYISGGTLKEKIGEPVPLSQALDWLIPIADALGYAHQRGVIHRDIKPSNILFDEAGHPILADFGIAKMLESTEATLTGTGLGVGTPDYMAPEQWQGKSNPAADQYALGVVLYELITGRRPYQADTPADVAIMQVTQPLPSPAEFVPDLPEGAERVLFKALAKDPKERFTDMRAFRIALEKMLLGGVSHPSLIVDQPRLLEKPESEEAITRDHLETSAPLTQDHSDDENTRAKRGGMPKWVIWAGIGIVGFCLLGGVLAGILGAFTYFLTQRNSDGLSNESLRSAKATPEAVALLDAKPTLTLTKVITQTPTMTRTPNPTSTPQWRIGSTAVNGRDGAEMVYVPEGEFLMGSESSDAHKDEGPEHIVFTDAFWIYKYPVTNLQFTDFVESTGYQTDAEEIGYTFILIGSWWRRIDGSYWAAPKSSWDTLEGRQDHPVIHVSYYDAEAYCRWAGGRLPTEAEWEKAARGVAGQSYPWGEEVPDCDMANYGGCVLDTAPVGSYLENISPYGVVDMAGNVWTWVADWYNENYYANSPGRNPQGPSGGTTCVVRGASWYDGASQLRAANREESEPDITNDIIGIRCVVDSVP